MKPHIIKLVLLVLTLLSFTAIAEPTIPTIPTEEAKKNFASCVTSGKAWAACYHHLHPANNNQTGAIAAANIEPPADYYAPRWLYTILPTINPPDDRQKTSPWEAHLETPSDNNE